MNSPVPAGQEGQHRSASGGTDVEAARYALLRRLAPSMRHHLVVNLQPIGMVYEIIDRRLRSPQPNLAEVHDGAHKINSYARAALDSCLGVITWLAPEEQVTTSAVEGVRECLDLIATSFTFGGFPLRNGVEPVPGRVRQAAMRNVLTGALLHLLDVNTPPAEIALSASAVPAGLRLNLSVTPVAGEPGFVPAHNYRALAWDDVQALATAEGVGLRSEARVLHLDFPWVRPA